MNENNEKTLNIFFLLLRLGLGYKEILDDDINAEEWSSIWSLSAKHAVIGIIFDGICQLPNEKKPPRPIILKWIATVKMIEQHNRDINTNSVYVAKKIKEAGFSNTILKGQGISLLYPNPLHRMPGDIDIWLEGGREKIMTFVRQIFPNAGARYHHVDFPILKNTEVEIHFTPSWLSSINDNRALQHWFKTKSEEQFENFQYLPEDAEQVAIATTEFNRIFLLIHIYRHFFDEGIGLRQLIDYALVLKQDTTDEEKQNAEKLLSQLHIKKFASGIMYIIRDILKIEGCNLIIVPDKKEGVFILREILKSGNFGICNKDIYYNNKSLIYYLSKFKYKIKFFKKYGRETLWGNIFWIWQYFWRIYKGYK